MQDKAKMRNCAPYIDEGQFEAAVNDARMVDFYIPICSEDSFLGVVERIKPRGVVLDTPMAVGWA
eukprot:2453444-Alexandrium_andersonii.AAC.1